MNNNNNSNKEQIAKVMAKVRKTGLTNMLDKGNVAQIAYMVFDESEISEAIKDLDSKTYMEVLQKSVKY